MCEKTITEGKADSMKGDFNVLTNDYRETT